MDEEQFKTNRRIYNNQYRKNNPDWYIAIKQRRRSLQRNAEGHFTAQQWKELKEMHKQLCAGCNLPKKLTVDHIIPLSKGGSNHIENIQPLCVNCNSQKSWKIK